MVEFICEGIEAFYTEQQHNENERLSYIRLKGYVRAKNFGQVAVYFTSTRRNKHDLDVMNYRLRYRD
ncbi:hypothetical protein ACQKP3_14845 [Vibrio sp. DNB22_10_4]